MIKIMIIDIVTANSISQHYDTILHHEGLPLFTAENADKLLCAYQLATLS